MISYICEYQLLVATEDWDGSTMGASTGDYATRLMLAAQNYRREESSVTTIDGAVAKGSTGIT
jgi:hypothetical protein